MNKRVASQRFILPMIGHLLSVLALLWIAWTVAREGAPLLAAMTWRLGAVFATAALIYTFLGGVLALAWWWLAGVYGDRPGVVPAVVVWSRSQFAKYLPGNVFHYASRQILGRRMHLGHETLVTSSVLEVLSLFLVAAFLAGAAAVDGGVGGDGKLRPNSVLWLTVALLALLALVAWPLIDRWGRRLPWVGPRLARMPRLGWRAYLLRIVPTLLLHSVFFLGTAGLLVLLDLSWRHTGLPWLQTVGMYALAWSAGLVTPGAPGGLGVREAVLVLGLEATAGIEPGYGALLALALRVVTVMGDLLLYLLACRFPVEVDGLGPASERG